MLTAWTSEDIESILGQLNNQNLPFEKYAFTSENDKFVLLGKGASANVYRAETRTKQKSGYAIKVIGFGDKHVRPEFFRTSVEVQRELGLFQNNVVKIYDSVELRVWIEGNHTVTKSEIIDPYEEEETASENFLHLQFILMEELTPILIDNRFGKPSLRSDKLASFDEKEILKLAYDIGAALSQAHAEKLIHRDVKLENIFWTADGGHYKLGDFGIARTTDDGLASTVAFTKGYGAPEVVGMLEGDYDFTADIYSFGMLLYVLLNELRFSGSKDYHPNVMQYARSFKAEYPTTGSDEFRDIVLKMISYDPDDRYQTMDEVLNAFDGLKYSSRLKYLREHKAAPLAVGAALASLGAVAFELAYMPGFTADFSIWMYLFWGLCVWKGITKLRNKDMTWISFALLGLGIYLMISTGFTWWKLLGVALLSFFGDYSTGIIGSGTLLMNITFGIMKINSVGMLREYSWIAVLLLSLSFFLLFYHYVLGEQDEKMTNLYLKKNLYWFVVAAVYALLTLTGITLRTAADNPFDLNERLFGHEMMDILQNMNLLYVGAAGTVFCLMWVARETVMIFIEKQKERREIRKR